MGVVDHADAVALFEKRRAAWLAEDVDGYLACFADDIVMETPMGAPVRGMTDYAALVRRSLEAFRPASFEFHAIAVHGDQVLAEWTIALDSRRGDGRVTYRGMSIGTISGGRIRTWREYYDPLTLRPVT
jgi:uncharacterized protein (TIGR02246 family)